MADANSTAPNPSVESATQLLSEASDEHCWRATSFVSSLGHMATADGPISPRDLAAIADALEDHVQAMAEAINQAHLLLTKG